jgi:hypothetical protein
MIWCGYVHELPANNEHVVRYFVVSVISIQRVREE